MLHMQHANVVALLVRQTEAERLKARRDAAAKPRPAAGAVPAPSAHRRGAQVHRPRPA